MSAEYILVQYDYVPMYLMDSHKDIWTSDKSKAEKFPDRFYLTVYARRCRGVVSVEKA